jgi:hypothetical protein
MSSSYCPPGRRAIMKAGAKDPRNILRNVRGYNPTFQADQIQNYQRQQRFEREMIPLAQAVAQAGRNFDVSSVRKVTYVSYFFAGLLGVGTAAHLLIPANPNRVNFYVSNLNGGGNNIYVSFGPPGGGIVTAVTGIPIQDLLTFSEINNTVSTDDIYVSFDGFPLINTSIMGYEGVPALTNA